MALLTARPEFAPTWADATNVTEVELGSLDPAESEIFIRKVAHDKPLPPEVVWKVRERAADNPLFLEEITRSILELGALVEREQRVGARRRVVFRSGARLDGCVTDVAHRPARRGAAALPARRDVGTRIPMICWQPPRRRRRTQYGGGSMRSFNQASSIGKTKLRASTPSNTP